MDLSSLRGRKGIGEAVCFAFEEGDGGNKQPELGTSGSVGSAVEDRPGKSAKFGCFFYLVPVDVFATW